MFELLEIYKPAIIIVHALFAAIGLGCVVVTDTLFFRFLKDFKISREEQGTLDTISRIIWISIFILFITGLFLFFISPQAYLIKSKFVTKVIIFGIIVLNGLILSSVLTPYLQKISFGVIPKKTPHHLRILRRIAYGAGVVSFISWLSVFILGSVPSIPLSAKGALLVYIALCTIGVVASQGYAMYVSKKR